MSETLKELLSRKRVFKIQLTKFKQKVSVTEFEISDFELLERKHKDLELELKECFKSIYVACNEDATESFEKEQEEINDVLDELAYELHRKHSKAKSDLKVNSRVESNSNAETNVKLPKMNLPLFSGNLHEWLSFKDIFLASIHQNKNLSDAMKLQYLKSSLKGDAFRIVQSISIVDSNYAVALSLLEERYSNSREQVYAHLKRFFRIPAIQNESAAAILNLIDISTECVRSLEMLDQKVDGFSSVILTFILSQKLDSNTKLWWERNLKKDNLPKVSELLDFLKDHARTLNASKTNVNVKQNQAKTAAMVSGVVDQVLQKCIICGKGNHNISSCYQFLKLSVRDRVKALKKHNLCFLCFDRNHASRNFVSKSMCNICNKKHNTFLCFDTGKKSNLLTGSRGQLNAVEVNTNEISQGVVLESNINLLNVEASPFEPINDKQSFAGYSNESFQSKRVLLSTAIVYIKSKVGNFFPAKCLLDCGLQSQFMSCELADKLELRKEKANVSVSCLTGVSMNVKFKTSAVIRNKGGGYSRVLDFLIVPKITQITPVSHVTISEMGIFENVNLADSEFNRPGKTELLLGAEVFLELLRFGLLHVPNSNLVLQNTVFGFIVGGSTKDNFQPKDLHCGLINEAELSREIKKFWEIESIDETDQFTSSEEIECNEHFLKTHKRDQSGRFVVQMPFKQDPRLLGDSKQIAIKRLNSLWNRLNKNPKLADLYCKFMTEYERLGHMERVMETKDPAPCYYLPHRGVYRPEKNSTKLRVVFNDSQITSTGESLNSLQMNGGVIQEDLFSIILRFRTHRYAFTADVRMMCRMINVDESQRDLQRIVWKISKSEEVKTYRLCTVTYGTTSAPYLAMRCLKQLSVDGEQQYPKASTIVKSDFYMDDVLTGAADLETA
ncbi:uncharacterized protein LOC129216512 [Uloborus diversus]|uniref:uncharacterized protein LOC129216512 n=1 Tax=Uloborus diversus TaxID=327109 RepID=UPI00240A7C2D|nr:uncharacterized protein LOC129216512 [Uloborus diversus]